MSISDFPFLPLFPLLLGVYYLPFFRKGVWRRLILCLASLCFYALGEPVWCGLIFLAVLLNYICVQIAAKVKGLQFFRIVAILFDAGLLIFFKSANGWFSSLGILRHLTADSIPVGLSYFSFLAISYAVDSKEHPHRNLWDTALYLTFFSAITSGPITKYRDFAPQTENRVFNADLFFTGLSRFAVGFIKKVLFSEVLGDLVLHCFAGTHYATVTAWVGVLAYTVQLYMDFSGYTDMAIGIGNLFGFTLAENFNYPYAAVSVSDFWKRWHISLTKWFTQYVYIPLGGSRVSPLRHVFNLLVVWLLTAAWHGSGWTFLIWGLIQFVFQYLEKKTPLGRIPPRFGHIYAALIILISWCFFRAPSLTEALICLRAMFGITPVGFFSSAEFSVCVSYALPLGLGLLFCFPIVPKLSASGIGTSKAVRTVCSAVLLLTFAAAVCMKLSGGYTAALYAGF